MATQNRLLTTRTALVVGLLGAALLIPLAAAASPLAPYTDHTGDNHSFESHLNADLTGIILASADLRSTDFKNAILQDAVLTSADLTGAILKNADLINANLTNASLTNVSAKNANFTNATLDGVSFATGDIRNAVFVGASLLGADLSNLDNADRADFTGAFYNAFTRLAPGMDTTGMTLVPEPSSAVLLLLGLFGLEVCGRPRRAAAR